MPNLDDLERLHALHQSGAINDEEYLSQKSEMFDQSASHDHYIGKFSPNSSQLIGIVLLSVFVIVIVAVIVGFSSARTTIADSTVASVDRNADAPANKLGAKPDTSGSSKVKPSGFPILTDPKTDKGGAKNVAADPSGFDRKSNVIRPPTDGQPYANARRQLLAQGLKPAAIPRGPYGSCGGSGEDDVCATYPETVNCKAMGNDSGSCRMAFVSSAGRYYVVQSFGWDDLKSMTYVRGAWANPADTKRIDNIVSGKPEIE